MKQVTVTCLTTNSKLLFNSRRIAERELKISESFSKTKARKGYIIKANQKDGKKDSEEIKNAPAPLNETVGTINPIYIFEKNHFLYINQNHTYKNYSSDEIKNHLENKIKK